MPRELQYHASSEWDLWPVRSEGLHLQRKLERSLSVCPLAILCLYLCFLIQTTLVEDYHVWLIPSLAKHLNVLNAITCDPVHRFSFPGTKNAFFSGCKGWAVSASFGLAPVFHPCVYQVNLQSYWKTPVESIPALCSRRFSVKVRCTPEPSRMSAKKDSASSNSGNAQIQSLTASPDPFVLS